MNNKLTDEEIKKALECCIPSYNKKCDMCPYEKLKPTVFGKTLCSEYMRQDIFDLINRLQAENERLKIRLRKAEHQLDDSMIMYNTIKSEAYKEFVGLIKDEITDAIISNGTAIKERVENHNVNRYEDNICVMCDGKVSALVGIEDFLDNLLKELKGTD